MRQKSKIFVAISILLVVLMSVFVLTACNKKQASTDPNEIYKSLLGEGVEITGNVTADKSKQSIDANSIKPYDAFKKLLNGLKISQGPVVENFMKNGNNKLNQKVETIIQEDKNGETTQTRIITTASLELDASNPNDLTADKNEVSIEVFSTKSLDPDQRVFGFYYKEGKLLFKIFNGAGSTLKPLYISDVQLNKIYYYFSRYGFDEYFRKIASDILSGDITLNVDGNSIKLLEFIGPVIFPIIFNTEVKVSQVPDNPELTRYDMGFNLGKFVNAMLPVIAKVPQLVENLLGDKLDEIGSINTLVNAFIKKYDEKNNQPPKGLTIEDLKHYPVTLNNSNFYFVLAKDGSIESIGKSRQKAVFDKYLGEESSEKTQLEFRTSNTRFFIEDSLNAADIQISFPEDIETAFNNVEELIDNGNEFNFGKLDLQLAIDLQTKEDRTITLAELMLFDANELRSYNLATEERKKELLHNKIAENVGSIDNLNNKFYAMLGVAEEGKNLSVEAIEKLYTTKLSSILVSVEQETLKSAYNQYKTTNTFKYLIQNLSDKTFTISAGVHGFKLKIRSDIRLNANIHKSTLSVELTDTSDNNLVLIGVYLLPSTSVGYSDVLLDLSGIGMPKVMIGSIDLKSLIYNPFLQKMSSFLRDLSSKGLIGFIMGMVAEKKNSGNQDVTKEDVQASLNNQNSASVKNLKLMILNDGKDKQVIFNEANKLQAIQSMAMGPNGDLKLLDYIAAIVNDSSIDGGMLNLVLSQENLSGVLRSIKNLSKDNNGTTGLMLGLINNLIDNSIKDIRLSVGVQGVQGEEQLESWSNIAGKLQISVAFQDDDESQPANTRVSLGIEKLQLFFYPGEDYKARMDIVKTARDNGEFLKLTELKKVIVSTKIRLLVQSGQAGNLELIQFLKNLSPELKDKLEKSEDVFFKGKPNHDFSLDITATEGFDLAIQISIELSARINALEDFGVTEEAFKNLASFAGLKVLFSKVSPEKLLKQINAKIQIDISKSINAVISGTQWRDNPEWDRYDGKPFLTLMYDSEVIQNNGNINGDGTLYIDFGDTTLPDLKQNVNLVQLINEKLKTLGAKEKSSNKEIVNDASGEIAGQENAGNITNTEEKKKEKAKIDAASMILGVIGGISFTSREFQITLANTALGVILKTALAGVKDSNGNPVVINEESLPKAKISFGMSYSTTGIGINLALTDILFSDTVNQTGGMKILLSISDLHIAVSTAESTNYVPDSEKDKYTSIDELVTEFNLDKIVNDYETSGGTKGKYVAVNLALRTNFILGNTNGDDFLHHSYQQLYDKLEELIQNANPDVINEETKKIFSNLSGYLHLDSPGRELIFNMYITGRVNISKLLSGVKKMQTKNVDPVVVAKAKSDGLKDVISSLNIAISLQFSISENQTMPDRMLTLYIDGDNLKVYGRLYTNLQLEGQTVNDSKLMINLSGDNWTAFERLFLAPKSDSSNSLSGNAAMAKADGEESVATNVLTAFKDYLTPLLNNLKGLMQGQNILGLLSAVRIGQQGIAIVTSAEVLRVIMEAVGIEDTDVGIDVILALGVNLFPKEGGLVGINLNAEVKNDEKTLFQVDIGIPYVGAGLDFSNISDDDPNKKARIDKMLPINQLGEERFLGMQFLNGRLSSYPDILKSGANNMRIGATLALNVDTTNPGEIVSSALKEVMENFGLNIPNLNSNFSMDKDEKLVLDFMIDIPLSKIANKIFNEIKKSEYSLEELKNPAVKEKLKNALVKGIIEALLNGAKIKIAIRIENPITHYTNNLLVVYYEGPSIGDFIFIQSSLLGIEENGLKINGAPKKIVPLIVDILSKKYYEESDGGVYYTSSNNTESIALELITKLLNRGASVDEQQPTVSTFVELINGKLSFRIKSILIQGLLQIFGVDLNGIALYRFVNTIGLDVEQKSNDTTWGVYVGITGIKDGQYTDSIRGKLELYNLFISIQKIGGELVPTQNATNISLTSLNPQYVSFKVQLGLGVSGSLSNIEWNPTINLLATILKYIDGVNITEENMNKIKTELLKFIGNKVNDSVSLDDKYALEISARINIQDIFRYFERLDIAKKEIVEVPGTYEYLKAQEKAKLSTNFQLSYASLGLTLKKKDRGEFKRLFGLIYDSNIYVNEMSNGQIIKVPHQGLIFRGSDPDTKVRNKDGDLVDFNFLSGEDIFLNFDNLGLDLISTINSAVVKSNKAKLTALNNDELVIGGNTNSSTTGNETNETKMTADEVISLLDKITSNIATINIVDKSTRAKYSDSIRALEESLNSGTLTAEAAEKIRVQIESLRKALNNGQTLSVATTYMNIQGLLLEIANRAASAAFLGDAIREFEEQNPGAELNCVKATANLAFPLNIELGLEFNKVGTQEPGFGISVSVGGIAINVDRTLREGIYDNQMIANLKPAKDLNLDLSTSINLYLKSPEYLFSPNLAFEADSPMSILSRLKTEIKMGSGFSDNPKHVKISVKARVNFGDIFDQVSARNYKSKVMLIIDVSGYESPIIIYTNLNDILIDLSAFNMPKFKITDLDLLTIIKGAIQSAIDQKEVSAAQSNASQSSSNTSSQSNGIDKLLKILGYIKEVDTENDDYTHIELEPNMLSALFRSLMKLESGLDDFTRIYLDLYKTTINYGYGFDVSGIHLGFERTLGGFTTPDGVTYAGGDFGMDVVIGRVPGFVDEEQVETKLGLYYVGDTSIIGQTVHFDINEDEYIPYHSLALKLRAETEIKFKSEGKPFMDIGGLLALVFNSLGKGYTQEDIQALQEDSAYTNVSSLFKVMNKLNTTNDISSVSGVYSKTDEGVETIFRGYLNADIPLSEIFTTTSVNNSKLKIQLLVVEDSANSETNTVEQRTVLNILYSQEDKMLAVEFPILGISGVKLENFDLLGLIKGNLKVQQFIESLAEMSTSAKATSAQKMAKDETKGAGQAVLRVSVLQEGIDLSINSSVISLILEVIENKLIEDVNNAVSEADKKAAQDKKEMFGYIKDAIPTMSEIALKYVRPNNSQTGGESGKAEIKIVVEQGVKNETGVMTVELTAFLNNRPGTAFKVIDSCNAKKPEYATFYDQDPIQEIEDNKLSKFSSLSFDKLMSIVNGAPFAANLPIRKIDLGFDATLDIKLTNDSNSIIKKLFEILDKELLKTTNYESGFIINEGKEYNFKLEARAILDFDSPTAFKNNSGVKLVVKDNEQVIMAITYIAKDNAIYIDLEKLGLMKIKMTGINLLAIMGPTLFPENASFITRMAMSGATPEEIADYNKIRTELDIRSELINNASGAVSGIRTKVVVKINDTFIKKFIERIAYKKINDLLVANSADYNPGTQQFNDPENQKVLDAQNKLLEYLNNFSFNDIMLAFAVKTELNGTTLESGIDFVKLVIDLENKKDGGRIYNTEDFANSNQTTVPSKGYIKLEAKNFKFREFIGNNGIYTNINDIIPTQAEAGEYAALSMGDLKALAIAKDKTNLRALIFNVIQLITGADGADFLNLSITNNSSYNGDTSKRSLFVKAKRDNTEFTRTVGAQGSVKSGIKVVINGPDGSDVNAYLSVDQIIIKINSLPGTTGVVSGLMPIITGLRIGLGPMLRDKLGAAFNPQEEVTTTPDDPIIEDQGEFEKYTYSPGHGINSQLAIGDDGNLLRFLWSGYNYHYTKMIPISQLEKITIEGGQWQASHNKDMYLAFWDKEGKYIGYHKEGSRTYYLQNGTVITKEWLQNNVQSISGGSSYNANNIGFLTIYDWVEGNQDLKKLTIVLKKKKATPPNVKNEDGKVDISKIIKSIQINAKDPQIIKFADNSVIGSANDTSIVVNLVPTFVTELINFANGSLFKLMGYPVAAGGDDSKMVVNTISAFVLSMITSLNGSAMQFSNQVENILPAVVKLVKAVFPLPSVQNGRVVEEAYAKVLLEKPTSGSSKIFRAIQIKITTSASGGGNEETIEVLLDNNGGIKIDKVTSATQISVLNPEGTIESDIYSATAISKTMADMNLPQTTTATIQNKYSSYGHTSHKMDIAWVQDESQGAIVLDPTQETTEANNNYLVYKPYVTDVEVSTNSTVKIKLGKNAVRKANIKDGKFEVYVKINEVWEVFDYSKFQNILPGQRKLVINPYIASITDIGIQMVNGNNELVDGKTEVEIGGATKKLYVFSAQGASTKFNFDISMIPQKINDYFDESSNLKNGKFSLTYGNGIVKNVMLEIPYTLSAISLDEEKIIQGLRDYLKEITKTEISGGQFSYNDPSKWNAGLIVKLQSKKALANKIQFIGDPYGSDYKFSGSAFLPLRVTIENIDVEYLDDGSIVTPGLTNTIGTDIVENVILGLYVPPYRPVRIHLKNVIVTASATLNDKETAEIGEFKLLETLKLDLYPPYDVKKYSSLNQSLSQSMSGAGYAVATNRVFTMNAIYSQPMSGINYASGVNELNSFVSEQSMSKAGGTKKQIPISFKADTKTLSDLYSSDPIFTKQLKASDVTTLMRFDADDLESKILGTINDNKLAMWITKIGNSSVSGDNADDRINSINTILQSDEFKNGEEVLTYEQLKNIIKCTVQFQLMSAIKNEYEEGKYYYVFRNTDNGKISIKFTFNNDSSSPFIVSKDADESVNPINKIVQADVEFTAPKATKWNQLVGTGYAADSIDIFYRNTINGFRKVESGKDQALENITKINGASADIANIKQYFTIIGTEEKGFDSFSDVNIDWTTWDSTMTYPEGTNTFARIIKEKSNGYFNFSMTDGTGTYRTNELNKLLAYSMSFELFKNSFNSDGTRLAITTLPGTIKFDKGKLTFIDEKDVELKDLLGINETSYYLTSYNTKQDFINALTTFKVGDYTFNRYILRMKSLANYEFANNGWAEDDFDEEKIRLLSGNDLITFKSKYDAKEKFITSRLGAVSVFVFKNESNPNFATLNDGTSGQLRLQVTNKGAVKFMTLGDNLVVNTKLNVDKAAQVNNGDNFDVSTLKIKANIVKGQLNLYAVSRTSTGDTRVLMSEYSDNLVAVDTYLSNKQEIFGAIELTPVYDWGLDAWEKDVLGNYVVKKSGEDLDGYQISSFALKYGDENITANFDIKFSTELKQGVDWNGDTVPEQLKFTIMPKTINISVVLPEDRVIKLPYLSKQPSYQIEGYYDKYFEVIPKVLVNGSSDLSKLQYGMQYPAELDLSTIILKSNVTLTPEQEDVIKKNFIFVNKTQESPWYISVVKRKVYLDYKDVATTYSNEVISLEDILILSDKDKGRIFDEYLAYDKLFKVFKLTINGIKVDLNVPSAYQRDGEGNVYINALRINNLGAGTHVVTVDINKTLLANEPFEIVKGNKAEVNISVSKKAIKIRIGRMLKYYGQDIDTDKIPITFVGGGLVEWNEYEAFGDEIKVVPYKDTISALGLKYYWKEDVGMQMITLTDSESDNYEIDVDETNQYPGEMDIRKTIIRLHFKAKMSKYISQDDPEVDPLELIFLGNDVLKAIEEEDEAKLDELYEQGWFEIELNSDVFSGQLVRKPGEKKGEYRYSLGTLSVDTTKYELVFVDSDGKVLANGIEGDKNAALVIINNPKALAPQSVKLLMTFVSIISIAVIGLGIMVRIKTKKIKKANTNNKEAQ